MLLSLAEHMRNMGALYFRVASLHNLEAFDDEKANTVEEEKSRCHGTTSVRSRMRNVG